MASSTHIVIHFRPLLKNITKTLNLPEPYYEMLDASTNNTCVAVTTEFGVVPDIYVGGEASSIEDSCEKAAHHAVRDLMKKNGITVEDVTLNRRLEAQRFAAVYNLKRLELERVEKGLAKTTLSEPMLPSSPYRSYRHVSIDFMSLLSIILRRFQVRSTPVETLEHSPVRFTSWITITSPTDALNVKRIIGECCSTLAMAKENLAKKVIAYAMDIYGFEVVDANYNQTDMKCEELLCALERESYLTIKERVLGIKEPVEPSVLLVEQDCITPRGVAYTVPSIVDPPLPPRKRPYKAFSARPSVVPPSKKETSLYFSVPAELEIVFKRPKLSKPLE